MIALSPSTTTFTYCLMRHGETVWNREKRLQGSEDSPLTESGKVQLLRWANILKKDAWQRIVCSDLGRARETAEIINHQLNLPLSEEPLLREQAWGDWEGLTISELKENYAEQLDQETSKGWGFRPPGGESREEVRKRIFLALDESRNHYPDQRTLIICHMGVIKCFLYSIAKRQFLPAEPKMVYKNRIHEIHYADNEYRLGQLNISLSAEE